MLVVQSNPFNASRIATVVVAVITSNLHGGRRRQRPDRPQRLGSGEILGDQRIAILTIDRTLLTEVVRALPSTLRPTSMPD